MTLQDFLNFTTDSLNSFANSVTNFLPNALAGLVIFLIGLIIAAILVRVWTEIVKVISLEKSLSSIDSYSNLVKGNKNLSVSEVVSSLIWWSMVLVFSIAALKSLGLSEVDSAFGIFFDYLPQLVSGALILVIGSVFAWYTSIFISAVGNLAKLTNTAMIAKLSSTAVMIFALFAALAVFGVDNELLKLIAQVAIVATGLAFALGGKEAASEQIKKVRDSFK
jgi:hypothetical protein